MSDIIESFQKEAERRLSEIDSRLKNIEIEADKLRREREQLKTALKALSPRQEPAEPAPEKPSPGVRQSAPTPESPTPAEPERKDEVKWEVKGEDTARKVNTKLTAAMLRDAVLEHHRGGEWFKGGELAVKMGYSQGTLRPRLGELVRAQILESRGQRRSLEYRYIGPSRPDAKPPAKRPAKPAGSGLRASRNNVPSGRQIRTGSKEATELFRECEKAGATVTKLPNGHAKVAFKGKSITLPSTPSDHRSAKNARARLRHMGLAL